MEHAILEYIKSKEHVSFVELTKDIPGFEGNLGMELGETNVFFWTACSSEAAEALNNLSYAGKIHRHPCSILNYMIDGGVVKMPLAKRSTRYKKPHWCPITYCSYPYGQKPPSKK